MRVRVSFRVVTHERRREQPSKFISVRVIFGKEGKQRNKRDKRKARERERESLH